MLFVAEIGMNHNGNFDLAHELIRQAKGAGADVAKFQFGWRDRPDEINHITPERAQALKRWCEFAEIEMLASIITEDALDLAHHVGLDRYKIASRTVIDKPDLCERILAEGKPTYVSLGMWTGAGFPFGDPEPGRLHYIYCRSEYPAQPWSMSGMPARFSPEAYFGYSDHLLGIEGCVLAVARGAEFIEKHFTLDKASAVIRDHVLSATPAEFRQLTDIGRPLARLVRTMEAAG